MIKLIDLIKEGKQVGTLYHHTLYYNAANIIGTNKLCSTNTPYPERREYAISFTRDSQFHGNFLSNEGGDQCRFVIDGSNLSNNYKITPYAESEWEPKAEWEEHIEKDHWFCIPILKYVERIDLLSEPENDFEQKHLNSIIQLCKEKGIKVNQEY